MVLGDSEIIQIDATIITGILILLTLSLTDSGKQTNIFNNNNNTMRVINITKMVSASNLPNAIAIFRPLITLTIIFPFAASAMNVLKDKLSKNPKGEYKTAIRFMYSGFIYIVVGIGILATVEYFYRAYNFFGL